MSTTPPEFSHGDINCVWIQHGEGLMMVATDSRGRIVRYLFPEAHWKNHPDYVERMSQENSEMMQALRERFAKLS